MLSYYIKDIAVEVSVGIGGNVMGHSLDLVWLTRHLTNDSQTISHNKVTQS